MFKFLTLWLAARADERSSWVGVLLATRGCFKLMADLKVHDMNDASMAVTMILGGLAAFALHDGKVSDVVGSLAAPGKKD
jgi:hypothetical protein